MAGTGQQVDRPIGQVDGQVTGRLCRVDKHQCVGIVGDAADVVDRLHDAGHIRCMLDRHQSRGGSQGVLDQPGVDSTGRIDIDDCQFDSASVHEFAKWSEHRVVFGGGGDDVIPGFEQSVEGDIESVGGVEGPGHSFGRFGTQQISRPLAARPQHRVDFDRRSRSATSGRRAQRSVEVVHRRVDRLGLRKACGRVVEINAGHGWDPDDGARAVRVWFDQPPIECIGRSGWTKLAVLISCPWVLA